MLMHAHATSTFSLSMADDRMCLGPISFLVNLHYWDITETGLRLQLLD